MTAISQISTSLQTLSPEFEPSIIKDGVFGARFYNKDGEPLFLRMELLTPDKAECWAQFQRMAMKFIGYTGLFTNLVDNAGTENCPAYDKAIAERTGFSKEEYDQFNNKATQVKEKKPKISLLLEKNQSGITALWTSASKANELRYIVYVSKNPNFSIPLVKDQDANLKTFFNKFSDILISMGSDFTEESSFHNRGISRNPYWVFEGKYEGLSMLLHGFTAKVAEKFFHEKVLMEVMPIGSMLRIIKDNLKPGEGYFQNGPEKTDITDLTIGTAQSGTCYIQTPALVRIYHASMQTFRKLNVTHGCSYPLPV